ncbi:hypothetical protein AGMMS50230_00390 [Spirochaetia bacterium]|nr:hypothetical protein AGMMS50230_00390 [Spirochaetia bacterium]
MKKFISVLIFAAFFCTAAEAQQRAAWTEVQSLEELIGNWEGSQVLKVPKNAETGIPQSSLPVTISLNYVSGNELTITIIMDLNQLLKDWSALPELQQQGITKDALWQSMLSELSRFGVDYSENYTITFRIPIEEAAVPGDDSLTLNRNRTRLKITFPSAISLGLGDEGLAEIILSKTK